MSFAAGEFAAKVGTVAARGRKGSLCSDDGCKTESMNPPGVVGERRRKSERSVKKESERSGETSFRALKGHGSGRIKGVARW